MSKNPNLAPGQIWCPIPGKRAKARQIVRLDIRFGAQHLFWSTFAENYVYSSVSPIRVDGFHKWIRLHGATLKEPLK